MKNTKRITASEAIYLLQMHKLKQNGNRNNRTVRPLLWPYRGFISGLRKVLGAGRYAQKHPGK